MPQDPERSRDPISIASPGRRFAAWVLDAAVASVILLPLNPALYGIEPDQTGPWFGLFAGSMVLLFGFLVVCDASTRGATPGKRIVGIRVSDEDNPGEAIGLRRALARRTAYLVGGVVFYIGWLMALRGPQHQALHDKVSRTLVTEAR